MNNELKNITNLSIEQIKRVKNDILDTQKSLNKELTYSKDLQNSTRIAQLESHISKLNKMILNGWNAPKFN